MGAVGWTLSPPGKVREASQTAQSRSRASQDVSPHTQLHATDPSPSAPHRAAFLATTVYGGTRERRPRWLYTVINTGARPPCEGAACGAGRQDLLSKGQTAPSSQSISRSEAISATPSTCSWPRAGLEAPGRSPGSVLGLPGEVPVTSQPARPAARGHPRAHRRLGPPHLCTTQSRHLSSLQGSPGISAFTTSAAGHPP